MGRSAMTWTVSLASGLQKVANLAVTNFTASLFPLDDDFVLVTRSNVRRLVANGCCLAVKEVNENQRKTWYRCRAEKKKKC